MKNLSKLLFLLPAILISTALYAQADDDIGMADALRQDGKIWVVVGVILIIFAGIALYLFRLERKVSKLEREVKERNSKKP